jgi:hypothetical protein
VRSENKTHDLSDGKWQVDQVEQEIQLYIDPNVEIAKPVHLENTCSSFQATISQGQSLQHLRSLCAALGVNLKHEIMLISLSNKAHPQIFLDPFF